MTFERLKPKRDAKPTEPSALPAEGLAALSMPQSFPQDFAGDRMNAGYGGAQIKYPLRA